MNAAFLYRRKKIYKSLSISFPEINWKKILSEAGIDPDLRPESVSPDKWFALAQRYRNLLNEAEYSEELRK